MFVFDWFASQFLSAALHWLAYWGIGIAIVGGGAAAAFFSPIFKTFFIGVSGGAAMLLMAQSGLVSFTPKQPQICENPATDPNGPTTPRCFHKTDERGFGYWGDCDGQ